MSEAETSPIVVRVPGDWPWIYAAFMMLRTLVDPYPQHANGRPLANGYTMTIYRAAGDPVGTIVIGISDAPNEAKITATPATAADAAYWQEITRRLRGFAYMRRDLAPTPDEMVTLFYRRKAQEPRLTLRKFADENLWNYAALAKHKQRYDATRRKTKSPQKTNE